MAGTTTTYMYDYIGDEGADGAIFGAATISKRSFYGSTPIAQRSGANQAAVLTTAISAITTTGTATTTDVYNLQSTVNSIITRQALLITLANELRLSLVPTTGVGLIAGA